MSNSTSVDPLSCPEFAPTDDSPFNALTPPPTEEELATAARLLTTVADLRGRRRGSEFMRNNWRSSRLKAKQDAQRAAKEAAEPKQPSTTSTPTTTSTAMSTATTARVKGGKTRSAGQVQYVAGATPQDDVQTAMNGTPSEEADIPPYYHIPEAAPVSSATPNRLGWPPYQPQAYQQQPDFYPFTGQSWGAPVPHPYAEPAYRPRPPAQAFQPRPTMPYPVAPRGFNPYGFGMSLQHHAPEQGFFGDGAIALSNLVANAVQTELARSGITGRRSLGKRSRIGDLPPEYAGRFSGGDFHEPLSSRGTETHAPLTHGKARLRSLSSQMYTDQDEEEDDDEVPDVSSLQSILQRSAATSAKILRELEEDSKKEVEAKATAEQSKAKLASLFQ